MGEHSPEFIEWVKLQMQGKHLPHLLDTIRGRRDGLKNAALAKGETDYEKGQYAALDWVCDLPADIAKTELS